MSFYCPATISNFTSDKCIGNTIIWSSHVDKAVIMGLLFLPLMILVAWLVFGGKE